MSSAMGWGIWAVVVIVGTPLYSSHSVLLNLCKVNGEIPFHSSSVVLLTELLKLIVSVVCGGWKVFTGLISAHDVGLMLIFSLPYSIPALLYCINNNLAVLLQHYMDPATFQVLGNMKIVATAIVYVTLLNRKFSTRQCVSLVILTAAAMLNSYGNMVADRSSDAPWERTTTYITQTGVCLVTFYCFISAAGGIFTEIVMKRHPETSIFEQNTIIYVYGIVMNYVMFLLKQDGGRGEGGHAFLGGFTPWTWAVVVSQACNGLLLSFVMKHSSNLLKIFISTSAIFLNVIFTSLLFGLALTTYFYIALFMVVIAIIIFHAR